MKLIDIIEIKGILSLETGLHIGSGDHEMHIGGIDNAVLKNPITNLPYIPGSSLKGKIRSLLEWRSGQVKTGEPLKLDDAKDNEEVKNILRLFGLCNDAKQQEEHAKEIGVPRLAFWDCEFTPEWREKLEQENLLATEAKYENVINRITATAMHPRQSERVPAGSQFAFKVTMRKFENDGEQLQELFLKGLRLLELDSLGGSGSRGYGKIKFENLTVNNEIVSLEDKKPFEK